MDPKKWELWRTADGVFVAFRMGTRHRVMLRAATAQEREDKIDAWEREHQEDRQ